MFDSLALDDLDDLDDLDAGAVCEEIRAAHRELVEVEARQLRLAAHWIDLHAPEDHPDGPVGVVLPGTERSVRVGADGTPLVREFAAAEFAAVQDMHPAAGSALLRKVADLRHRHPLLWERVQAGEVRAWKALETARLVGRTAAGQPELPLESARWVDSQTHAWVDTLPWGSYLALVEKTVIAADPRRAETCRLVAETEQYVVATQSTEHGLKTLVAKATAGEVLYLVAVVDRLAEVLAGRGDTRPVGARRAAALGLLARPAHALALLAAGSSEAGSSEAGSSEAGSSEPDPSEAASSEPDPSEADSSEADSLGSNPADDGALVAPSYLDLPADLVPALCRVLGSGGSGSLDLDRLLPRATLYVHIGHEAIAPGSSDRLGALVAEVEGVGPVTLDQARCWLGHHRVTVVPVMDPGAVTAVDGYQFTPRLREALRATVPRDVFPWAVNLGRRQDIDHPEPYVPPDRGGPPGQTGLHNAAPLTRRHHRIKTHGAWDVSQLTAGTYLWRSPHKHYWVVDATGTYRVPASVGRWIHGAHREARAAA